MEDSDITSLLDFDVEYELYTRDRVVSVPRLSTPLTSLELEFWVEPATSRFPENAPLLTSPEALQFYADDLNCSASLAAEIQRLWRSLDPEAARVAFLEGVGAWLKYLRSFNVAVFNARALSDEQTATQWNAAGNLGDKLSQLSDVTHGVGGSLHLTHFLYRHVSLPRIDLRTVVNHARVEAGAPPIALTDPPCETITFSCGRAPAEDPPPSRGVPPKGRLRGRLWCFYRNPLAEPITQIQSGLEDLTRALDGQRTAILDPLRNDFDSFVEESRAALQAAISEVDRLRQAVENIRP